MDQLTFDDIPEAPREQTRAEQIIERMATWLEASPGVEETTPDSGADPATPDVAPVAPPLPGDPRRSFTDPSHCGILPLYP